jgi:hypothetical protein
MGNHSAGKVKVKFVYYLSITTLVLLLAAIFFTINNAMNKQAIYTNAQIASPTVTITPLPSH